MKSLVRPELPTASVGSSQATNRRRGQLCTFCNPPGAPLIYRGKLFRQPWPLLMTVQRVHSALNVINEAMKFKIPGFSEQVKTTKAVTQFSDSIIVSYRMTELGAVFDMLYDIYLLQISLIQQGISVRGAISMGKLFHDEHVVFGPALVEAAELEKLAMYPRVILSKETLELGLVDLHGDPDQTVKSLVKEDLDGMYFIDYFGVSPGEFHDGWDGLYTHMIELRQMILRLSRLTKNPSLKLKHSWMRKKFNEVAIPLEKSRFTKFNGSYISEDTQDAFISISPFR